MNLDRILFNFLERSDDKRENNRARGRAKTLAKRLGVTIESERDQCGMTYWLHNTGREDENFCTSWMEVEDNLKRVAAER